MQGHKAASYSEVIKQGQKARTYNRNIKGGHNAEVIMFQQQFFSCGDMPFLAKKLIFSRQRVAENSARLSSCVMKQGQNDLTFQYRILYIALANFPCRHEPISASCAPPCALSLCQRSYAYVYERACSRNPSCVPH